MTSWLDSLVTSVKKTVTDTIADVRNDLGEFVDTIQSDTKRMAENVVSGAPQTNPSSLRAKFLKDPSDPAYTEWFSSFDVHEQASNITQVLGADEAIRALHSELIPKHASYKEFWGRYYFQFHANQEEHAKRAALIKRMQARERQEDEDGEDDFSDWADSDSDGDEGKDAAHTSAEQPATDLSAHNLSLSSSTEDTHVASNKDESSALTSVSSPARVESGAVNTTDEDDDDDDDEDDDDDDDDEDDEDEDEGRRGCENASNINGRISAATPQTDAEDEAKTVLSVPPSQAPLADEQPSLPDDVDALHKPPHDTPENASPLVHGGECRIDTDEASSVHESPQRENDGANPDASEEPPQAFDDHPAAPCVNPVLQGCQTVPVSGLPSVTDTTPPPADQTPQTTLYDWDDELDDGEDGLIAEEMIGLSLGGAENGLDNDDDEDDDDDDDDWGGW